ncbi:MAG: phosphopantetheine-binding protein, partial [Candidatus Methylumidiphilus sp.]
MLGFDQVGVDDDFFELGGDSLLAIRLMNGIKGLFGRQLPLPLLLGQPTIRRMAEALCAAEPAPAFSPLVALHTAGDGPALFFVPGTGGGVVYLHDLARCLGEYGHPFYGFQALGVDGRSPPLTR